MSSSFYAIIFCFLQYYYFILNHCFIIFNLLLFFIIEFLIIEVFYMKDKRNGIVHIIGPEQGFTQPGTIIVCGDSHTATHGAFGGD